MKRCWLVLSTIIGFILLIGSCAPKAEPQPKPAQVIPAIPQTVSTPSAITASPDEVAWATIIQAAKKEGKVTVYSFSMSGDVGLAVSRSIEQKYGIKLEIITAGSGAALGERINTEKRMGTLVADIMDSNTLQIGNIKSQGTTASSQEISVLQERGVWTVEPWANDPEKHILIHSLQYSGNIINTNLVKAGEEPKSLKELTASKWIGKMVYLDPKMSSSASMYWLTMLRRKLIDQDIVQEIGKGIRFTSTSFDSAQALMQGQYALMPAGLYQSNQSVPDSGAKPPYQSL